MGLFTNPLGHAGYPPGVTGTPSTQPTAVRAATAAEAAAGLLNDVYISPATVSGVDAAIFASPPPLGSTTANTGAFTALHLTTSALSVVPTVVTAGASPQTANARIASVTFSSVSIASGATQSFEIDNTTITGSTTDVLVTMYGVTAGSALSIASVTPAANKVTIVVTNGTSATMVTSIANITFTIWVLN